MGATSYSSVDELNKGLLALDTAYVHIEHRASDDLTATFLEKAAQLLEQNKNAHIICSDEAARQTYLKHVAAYPTVKESAILTVSELCLALIKQNDLQQVIGRDARLLDENEYDVLLEDMKVSGLKPRRLREMLKFFFKAISDCANEKEGWLISGEEQRIHAIFEENLDVRRAMIACELPSKTYHGLQEAGKSLDQLSILVDDYNTLSKASQRLLEMLATDQLVVAGTAVEVRNAEESYPWLEGFTKFVEAHDNVESLKLEAPTSAVKESCTVLNDPQEEFTFVADEIEKRITEGTRPQNILVAVPNSTWKKYIKAALTEKGIAVTQSRGRTKVKGDPRSLERAGDLKLSAFLKLLLDPTDLTALRSWLGIGDWLLRSDAFLELMTYARENEIDLTEALIELRVMPPENRPTQIFYKFDEPLVELDTLNLACAHISINEAVSLFEQHDMPLHPSMITLLGDNPAKADLKNLARYAFDPNFKSSDNDNAVTLATYRQCHGHHVDSLFITGLVNGFLPAPDAIDDHHTIDHKRKAIERERRLFEDVEATARKEVVHTSFMRDRLENVEVMNLQASKIYIKDSVRLAHIEPSEFIQSA